MDYTAYGVVNGQPFGFQNIKLSKFILDGLLYGGKLYLSKGIKSANPSSISYSKLYYDFISLK